MIPLTSRGFAFCLGGIPLTCLGNFFTAPVSTKAFRSTGVTDRLAILPGDVKPNNLHDDRQALVRCDREGRSVGRGIPALGPTEHTGGLQRRVLHTVPAQAIAEPTG